MCIILKDFETKILQSRGEFEAYLEFREKNDKWFVSSIQRMQVLAGNGTPEEFKKSSGSAMSTESIQDCMENGTNLFLRFYTEIKDVEKRGTIPLRYTAIRSILDRAKIGGPSMTNTETEADIEVLSLNDKTKIINQCLALYHSQAKILYRDEKISSTMSGQYAILKERDITAALEEGLKPDFPKLEFIRAAVSHEHLQVEYQLNADEVEEDIYLALNDAGIGVDSVKSKIGMFTSDIGLAAVTIYAYLELDGKKLFFGRPINIKHIGSKTPADIKKAVIKLYSLFKQNPEDFRRLCEVKIQNPSGCLRSIAREIKLPKKYSMVIATQMDASNVMICTAYEVYWYLNQIISQFESDNHDKYRVIQLQESVAETLKLDFKRFDKPFEWVKGEIGEN